MFYVTKTEINILTVFYKQHQTLSTAQTSKHNKNELFRSYIITCNWCFQLSKHVCHSNGSLYLSPNFTVNEAIVARMLDCISQIYNKRGHCFIFIHLLWRMILINVHSFCQKSDSLKSIQQHVHWHAQIYLYKFQPHWGTINCCTQDTVVEDMLLALINLCTAYHDYNAETRPCLVSCVYITSVYVSWTPYIYVQLISVCLIRWMWSIISDCSRKQSRSIKLVPWVLNYSAV